MSTYNKVVLVGHLGGDPIIRELDSQTKVADLRIATNEVILRNGQPYSITDWHEVVAWRKLAEFSEKHLSKGRKILVEGRIRTNIWEEKLTGKKRKSVFILADRIRFMDKKESSGEVLEFHPSNDLQEASDHSFSLENEFDEMEIEETPGPNPAKKTGKKNQQNPIDPKFLTQTELKQEIPGIPSSLEIGPEWTRF